MKILLRWKIRKTLKNLTELDFGKMRLLLNTIKEEGGGSDNE